MLGKAGIVSLFAILSQLVAFIRTAIMAFLFGASSVVDAYNLALVVPVLLSGVVGGWLQAGFVGRYMTLRQHNEADAVHFSIAIGRMVLVIVAVLALAIFTFREPLASMLVPPASLGTRQLTEAALSVVAWSLVPTVLADFLGLILNCHGRFLAAATAPVVNAMVAAVALWLWPHHDLEALVQTLLLGWLAQMIVLAVAYKNAGLKFVARCPDMSDEIRTTLRLALPILPAVLFSNGTTVVIQLACSRLGEGAVAVYGYASRLHGALSQIMIVGIGTVLLPHLAGMLARQQRSQIGLLFQRLGRATMLGYAFILAGVFLLGDATILTILGRGKFDAALASAVADVWTILTVSLLPFAFATFLAKLFQAMQQPVLLSWSSLIAIVVTALVCYVGGNIDSLAVLVAAPLFAQLTVLGFFLACFRREFGPIASFADVFTAFARCALLVLPSMAVDVALNHLVSEHTSAWFLLLRVVLFIGIFLFAARVNRFQRWILQEERS